MAMVLINFELLNYTEMKQSRLGMAGVSITESFILQDIQVEVVDWFVDQNDIIWGMPWIWSGECCFKS